MQLLPMIIKDNIIHFTSAVLTSKSLAILQDGLFESATALLSHSFKRVQGMRRTNVVNCKFMCYFALVAVVLLLLFYWLLGHVMA